jgi:hypothetical protein
LSKQDQQSKTNTHLDVVNGTEMKDENITKGDVPVIWRA